MKENIEQSQESLKIKDALSADPELDNAHMFANSPAIQSLDEQDVVSATTNKVDITDVEKKKKPPSQILKKFPFAKLLKWLAIFGISSSVIITAVWIYANKSVLLSQNDIQPERPPITRVDETSGQGQSIVSNPFATQSDLREASYSIRQDFKEAMREFSRGLDKIDKIELQMGVLRSKFNELKTYVMQQKNTGNGGIEDGRYNELLTKLSELEMSLGVTASYASQIDSLKKMDKERQLLEAMLKNNDWDLRKRMERVEKTNGISTANKKAVSNSNASSKSNNNLYGASISHSPTLNKPRMQANVGHSKAVVWKNKHRWRITMISNALTQIQNIDTGKNYRISEGVEIKGCGIVLAIDVPDRTITTQHCVI